MGQPFLLRRHASLEENLAGMHHDLHVVQLEVGLEVEEARYLLARHLAGRDIVAALDPITPAVDEANMIVEQSFDAFRVARIQRGDIPLHDPDRLRRRPIEHGCAFRSAQARPDPVSFDQRAVLSGP